MSGDYPMHRGQEFQPEGRFKALDKIGDPLNMFLDWNMRFQVMSSILKRTRNKRELLARLVTAISIPADEVPFYNMEYVP